jgi:hypothetical protein
MSKRTLYLVTVPVAAEAVAYVWADSEEDAIDKASKHAPATLSEECCDWLNLDPVQWGAEGTRVENRSLHWSINVANDEDRPGPDDCEDCDADA